MGTRQESGERTLPLLERFVRVVPEGEREPNSGADAVTPPPISATGSDEPDIGDALLADVRANIEYLLKTSAPLAGWLKSGASRSAVERSVLAYGMPELIGRLRDGVGAQAFSSALRQTLLDHEPRLEPTSLRILIDDEEPDRTRRLTGEFDFRIAARVRGLDEERGTLHVRTVVHPFRAPEVDVGER